MEALLAGAIYVLKANVNMVFFVALIVVVTALITSVVKSVWKD